MLNIKRYFDEKRKLKFLIGSYEANENLLHVTEQTLGSVERDLYRLENPHVDDISRDGKRLVAESTAEILASKLAWFEENLGLSKEYGNRLQIVSNYFRRDKKLQIINSSFHRRLDELEARALKFMSNSSAE